MPRQTVTHLDVLTFLNSVEGRAEYRTSRIHFPFPVEIELLGEPLESVAFDSELGPDPAFPEGQHALSIGDPALPQFSHLVEQGVVRSPCPSLKICTCPHVVRVIGVTGDETAAPEADRSDPASQG